MDPRPNAASRSGPTSRFEPLRLPRAARRIRAALGTVLVLALCLVVTLTYLRIERELEVTLERHLESILDANASAAEHWLAEQENFARNLARTPDVVRSAARVVASGSQERPLEIRDFQARSLPWRLGAGATAIAILDPEGRPLASQSTANGFQPSPLSPVTLARLLERGSLVLPSESESARGLRSGVSALAVVGRASAPDAILLAQFSPHQLEARIDLARWGKSGETFAFDAAGMFLTEPRFEANPETGRGATQPQVALARTVWSTRPKGVNVDGYDSYRGVRVVGAWKWLSAYDLGIATEVPRAIAHESVIILRIGFVVLATLVGLGLLGFLALGRWTLRVRQESALVTERLGRLARTISALSAALENDPTAVLLVDRSGTVVYANASSHEVLRVHVPLVGQPVTRALANLPPELQAALDSGHDSITSGGTGGEDETLLVSSRDLRIEGQPHVLFLLRPITQQVRRQELEGWRNLLRVLSHELNNSLAPITSLVSSARKVNAMGGKDPQLDKIFDAISERTARLVSFLQSYRTIARLPHPAPREVDFRSFIDGLGYQTTFRLRGTPPAGGYFDPIQIERVLLNLLKNSLEAGSPADDIELRFEEEADSVRIDVLDRGSGMSEPVLKQAMLPFFSTKDGGTGVGLALAREVVEAHGGRMVLANRDGGGLVVSLYLPNAPPLSSRASLGRLRALEKPASDPNAGPVAGT